MQWSNDDRQFIDHAFMNALSALNTEFKIKMNLVQFIKCSQDEIKATIRMIYGDKKILTRMNMMNSLYNVIDTAYDGENKKKFYSQIIIYFAGIHILDQMYVQKWIETNNIEFSSSDFIKILKYTGTFIPVRGS